MNIHEIFLPHRQHSLVSVWLFRIQPIVLSNTETTGRIAQIGQSPPEIRLEIAKRLDRTARANLRLANPLAFNAAVREAVTHVKVTKREDFSNAINAYRAGGITTLDLSGSDITDDDLSLLKGLPGLKQLNLSGCENLTDAGLAKLKDLTSLQHLNLAGCKEITDGGVAHLQHLTSLRHLNLRRCGWLTDDMLSHLQILPSLQYLNLEKCDITDAGVAKLQHFPALQEVNLWGCVKITDNQVNLLREQLRNCLVSKDRF